MNKSVAIAALVAVGGVAASAGATALPSFLGSDTLDTVTLQAITACGAPANTLVYLGTGSGNGESGMINGTQAIAPMSRFLGTNICTIAGGLPELKTAQGLVVGLDGVSLLGSHATATAPGGTGTVCNGTDSTDCNPESTGLVFSGSVSVPSSPNTAIPAYTYTFTSWKDVLSVLYGGLSNPSQNTATGDSGCGSNVRNYLANNWGSLFQNPGCGSGVCTILQHAFRRDDSSGTSDIFQQLLGLSPSPTSESNRDFGTSPFCNVGEVGVKAATNATPVQITTTIPHHLTTGQTVTIVGVGKNIDNSAASGGNTAANGNNLTVTVIDGLNFTIANAAGPIAGNGSSVGSYAMVLLPPPAGLLSTPVSTDYRELDVIRRPCASAISAREDVCNRDGNLGLVLPVVPTDFLGSIAAQYPTATCTATNFSVAGTTVTDPNSGFAVKVPCPNGEPQHGGNLCVMPTDPAGNTNCLNTTGNVPFAFNTAAVNGILPGAADARVYNSHLLTGVGAAGSYQVDTFGRSIVGSWYRIHSAHTLAAGGTKCTQSDATLEVGCLVQASPCSIGYAGRTADQWDVSLPSFPSTQALKVNEVLPLSACVQSFSYALSRKLYLDTIVGWGNLVADDATFGPDELALASCESSESFIGPIMTTNNFVNFATGSAPNNGAPFAEDFDEPMLCPTQAPPASNSNSVAYSSNASPLPTNGTICGNGTLEQYEDCDDGTNGAPGTAPGNYAPLNGGNGHGTSNWPCSTTCRWSGASPPAGNAGTCGAAPGSIGTACTRTDTVAGSPVTTNGVCVLYGASQVLTCLP
jgi:hypothetical protein